VVMAAVVTVNDVLDGQGSLGSGGPGFRVGQRLLCMQANAVMSEAGIPQMRAQ